MEIIPTILNKEFEGAETKISLIDGLSKWVQIDVVDGYFTQGKTFELELLSKLPETQQLLWDIHLMVKEPEKWIEKCLFIGGIRVIGQVELMSNRESFVNKVKDAGMEAGVAFDVETGVGNIPSETDVVLLMARKAGFGNFETDRRVFEKIKKLQIIRDEGNYKFKIGIDGGVDLGNIKFFKKTNVDIVYIGGAIFNGDVEENWNKLQLTNDF